MQKGSREELIRRYLEGEMSVAEEHDFLIDAAVDRDLRLELNAQQTIDRAFVKDRPGVDPEQYGLLQQNVQGFLAATPHRRAFPSLRTGLIAGLLVLIGSLTVMLLPEGEEITAQRSGTSRPSEPIEQSAEAEADIDALPRTPQTTVDERSIAVENPDRMTGRAERPVRSPRSREPLGSPSGIENLPDGSNPENSLPTIADELEPMLRIGPERRLDSARGEEPDSIRFNLEVEWDLPE